MQGFPIARAGMVIGLLGGSFDPAHSGHAHLTRTAIRQLGLDRVWWLVSPGNPLKPEGPAPIARRMARARAVMRDPRVTISDLECRLGTRYTAQTLARLAALYPGVRFVWLMGADNLAQFHRWESWRWILDNVPVGVIARPGAEWTAHNAPAARAYRRAKLPPAARRALGRTAAPAWCFLDVPRVDQSSTAIRARGEWQR